MSPRHLVTLSLLLGIGVALAGPRWSPVLFGGLLLLTSLVAWAWRCPDRALAALAFLIPLQVRITLSSSWSLALGFIAISGLAAIVAYREVGARVDRSTPGAVRSAPPNNNNSSGLRLAPDFTAHRAGGRPIDTRTAHSLLTTGCWLLGVAALASLWAAADLGEAARRVLYLGWFLLLFWLVPHCVTRPEALTRIVRGIGIATVVASLIALAQFALQFWVGAIPLLWFWIEWIVPILEGERVASAYMEHGNNWILWFGGQPILRAVGPFMGPPDAGQYLVISLALSVAFAGHRPRLRARDLAALSLPVLFLVLSFSRQAWVALFAALVAMAVAAWRLPEARRLSRRLGWSLAAVLMLGGGVLGAGSVVPRESVLGRVVDRLQSIGDRGELSNMERLDTWTAAIVWAEAHPVLGVGLGNFATASGNRRGAYSHNAYLDFLVETGFLGMLALALTLGGAMVAAWRVASAAGSGPGGRPIDSASTPGLQAFGVGALGAVAGITVIFLLDDAFFIPRAGQMLWLLLGLIAAAEHLVRREARGVAR